MYPNQDDLDKRPCDQRLLNGVAGHISAKHTQRLVTGHLGIKTPELDTRQQWQLFQLTFSLFILLYIYISQESTLNHIQGMASKCTTDISPKVRAEITKHISPWNIEQLATGYLGFTTDRLDEIKQDKHNSCDVIREVLTR